MNWKEAKDGSRNQCQLSKVSESWMGWWTLLESLDPDALEVGEQQSKHEVEKRIISAELDRFMG